MSMKGCLQQVYLTAFLFKGAPTSSHSPLIVYLERSAVFAFREVVRFSLLSVEIWNIKWWWSGQHYRCHPKCYPKSRDWSRIIHLRQIEKHCGRPVKYKLLKLSSWVAINRRNRLFGLCMWKQHELKNVVGDDHVHFYPKTVYITTMVTWNQDGGREVVLSASVIER